MHNVGHRIHSCFLRSLSDVPPEGVSPEALELMITLLTTESMSALSLLFLFFTEFVGVTSAAHQV